MKDVVAGVVFFAVLIVSAAISIWGLSLCASTFATPDSSTWESAYVSESPNAHSYHYSEHCKALMRTTYDIKRLSVDEAEFYEYMPCSLCLKESVRHQWDGWAGLVSIPVGCLLLGLVEKINKKYKFRNPIVKR